MTKDEKMHGVTFILAALSVLRYEMGFPVPAEAFSTAVELYDQLLEDMENGVL